MAIELPRPHQDFHLLEAWNISDELFTDPRLLTATTAQLAEETGLTVVGRPSFHQYDASSISANVFLSESNIGVHTWRELKSHINFLLHTCSRRVDFRRVPEIASEVLQTDDIEFGPLVRAQQRWVRRSSGLHVPA